MHRLVMESRLEFVKNDVIQRIQEANPRCTIDILTGFETLDSKIRDEILYKREPLQAFLSGLDRVSKTESHLTSYVLYKPDPSMTDNDATAEAENTIDFLGEQCHIRRIPLTIRLNPMYLAKGSRWAELAHSVTQYQPPRLTDVMRLAEKKRGQGVKIYIGLSTEGLNEPEGTYISREDYAPRLIKPIKLFNDCRIAHFDWEEIQL